MTAARIMWNKQLQAAIDGSSFMLRVGRRGTTLHGYKLSVMKILRQARNLTDSKSDT